ncbi:MAG: GNAT family N-acetyltransferase [Pseudomonadota bacterium]
MAHPYTVRVITRADLPALRKVVASTDLFPAHLLDGMAVDHLEGSNTDSLWLTVDGPEPIAVAYAAPEPMTEGTWNLYLIAVHADWHGRGVGQELLRFVEQSLADQGQRLLLIETSGVPEFTRTREIYRRAGYQEEARLRDFYQAGEDKIVFTKRLN